jgi:UDP-glucose 4-epimerase
MPNVWVTGGAGYVGAHAHKALAKLASRQFVYDNLVSGHEWAFALGTLEKGDLLEIGSPPFSDSTSRSS